MVKIKVKPKPKENVSPISPLSYIPKRYWGDFAISNHLVKPHKDFGGAKTVLFYSASTWVTDRLNLKKLGDKEYYNMCEVRQADTSKQLFTVEDVTAPLDFALRVKPFNNLESATLYAMQVLIKQRKLNK